MELKLLEKIFSTSKLPRKVPQIAAIFRLDILLLRKTNEIAATIAGYRYRSIVATAISRYSKEE